jgi:WD40 repeat protein
MPITAIWMLDEDGQLVDDRQLQEYDPHDDASRETAGDATDTLVVRRKSQPRTGCLIVAMLAGDKNLGERLEECQEEGLAGIPVDELLGYMEEAAKGLDRLNLYEHDLGEGPMRIQHCDIKPANMMLVGGAVLVCDFGLAQVLGDAHVTQSITGSPAFMAPECFEKDGTSTNRDQYALAVAYHELRTGALPFDEESYAAVRDAHAKGTLNLSRLPAAEQVVIRRATSVKPSDRYPSSTEMVQALKQAVHPAESGMAGGKRSRSLGAAVALAALVVVAALAVWKWRPEPKPVEPLPETVELSFVPADVQVRIDGQARDLQDGKLSLTIGDQERIRIQVSHDDGGYQEIDARLAKDDLARQAYRLELRRFVELQFQPADVVVRVDDVGQSLDGGKLRLLLNGRSSIRISASDPNGMYQDLDQIYSQEQFQAPNFQIKLQPSARNYAETAYRRYDEGLVEEARQAFRAAGDLGYDTSTPVVDVATQTAGKVRLARISPQGRWLVVAGKNTEAVFRWDLSTADPAATSSLLPGHDDLVNCVAFSRDDGVLVTGGRDKTVRLWDLTSSVAAGQARILGQQDSDIVSVSIAPDKQTVVSADFAGTVRVWRLAASATDEPAATIPSGTEIREVRFDPSGQWLVGLSELGELLRWDMRGGDPASTAEKLATSDDEVKCISFSADGARLFAGASGGTLLAWAMASDTMEPAEVWAAHSDDIEALAISVDGKHLVTGGADREIRVWDLNDDDRETPRLLLGHTQLVSALSIGSGGRWLVTGSWDKTIRIWDLQAPNPAASCIVLEELADRVRRVATDPARRWLVACGIDGNAMLWDLRGLLLAAGSARSP